MMEQIPEQNATTADSKPVLTGNESAYKFLRPVNLVETQQQFYSQLKANGKSVNTLKNYKTDLDCFNNYLKTKQSELIINDFGMNKVSDYGAFLNQKYSSDNSRRRRVQALRIFFDFLVNNNVLSENPVRKLPTSPKFLDIPRPTPLTDLQKFWRHLSEQSKNHKQLEVLIAKRNLVIFLLVYKGGLKVSDLSMLKKDQVITGENPRVIMNPPKRDPYSIPLIPFFSKIYEDYMEHFNQYIKANEDKEIKKLDYVLFNANPYRILSGGLSPRGLEIIFEEHRNRLMINITPKSLRQSCIFNWLGQNKKDVLIKEWMGVAPSYSLKLYRKFMKDHIFQDQFLESIYTETINRS